MRIQRINTVFALKELLSRELRPAMVYGDRPGPSQSHVCRGSTPRVLNRQEPQTARLWLASWDGGCLGSLYSGTLPAKDLVPACQNRVREKAGLGAVA